jgi:hypothetical protein
MGEDCACDRTDGTEPRGSRLPRISWRTLPKNPLCCGDSPGDAAGLT